MQLYHFTLIKPGSIDTAITGCFSGRKVKRNEKLVRATEILVAKGSVLELYDCSEENVPPLTCLLSQDVFGVVRSMVAFKFSNTGDKDYIAIGSDSGSIVILEFNANLNKFVQVHVETYGKTGCRRIVPGQYLAADPQGRALMIGAIEKQKFVYVIRMDGDHLTISSPLEGHSQNTLVYSMIALDVGFDNNPTFACIEVNYEGADESDEAYQSIKKTLTIYELDLGKNTIVKKSAYEIDRSSNMLIQIPEPVRGVLICSENYITYRKDSHNIRVPIPRRAGMPRERGLMIVSSSMHMVKKAADMFLLVQSELGDLYKVSLDLDEQKNVKNISIHYFDTIPVANTFLTLKNGFIFSASEFSDHKLYRLKSIQHSEYEESFEMIDLESFPTFKPYMSHRHIQKVQDLKSLAPITDMKITDLMTEGASQFYALHGRGPHSSLRVLRYGLPVEENVSAPLEQSPPAIFTVKESISSDFDKYIIISFTDFTMVLSIGEKVEEVADSGFLTNTKTIYAANIGEEDLVQIHPRGIIHIGREGERKSGWDSGNKLVEKATVNGYQIVVALSGGEIIYFEYDTNSGQLINTETNDMAQDVACLALCPVSEGHTRARFLAVGFYDKTVRLISLGQYDMMSILSRQALPADPESLSMIELPTGLSAHDGLALYLNIGLSNGVLLRSTVDPHSGELSDTRSRFLGTRPVKLRNIKVKGQNAILALSSKPWLGYFNHGRVEMTPLSYPMLTTATHFASEQIPEGLVSIVGEDLRIISISSIADKFTQDAMPLNYTPRKFVVHDESSNMVILQSDYNTLKPNTRPEYLNFEDTEATPGELNDVAYGAIKTRPRSGQWVSSIRVYSPKRQEHVDEYEFEDNEAALSITTCKFSTTLEGIKPNSTLIVVGTAKDMVLHPTRKCACGYINLFQVTDEGKLQLIHKTEVEDVPYGLHTFRGRLLVGVKNMLRIYDLGKKKLLRKCENKLFPNFITSIAVDGNRIYVGDISESFHFVKYNVQENTLTIFADNTTPRWLTASALLDYNTIAGGDKFGNFFISRLPNDVSDDIEEATNGKEKWIWERGLLNGAPQKATEIVKFYVGSMITSLCKTQLISGGPSVLVYATITGSVGVFVPFTSKKDIDFFTHLEMHLREKNPPLCGRDHLAYRSYYFPVKGVIDGDLIEQFNDLDLQTKAIISEDLQRTPNEIAKKIEDMKNQTGL
ncbi:hypothetical protein FDP41_005099 [Naegleria fowleri]|uniref:DNA damage-binding protein 1 n=1 Tax=Naegleria fowleri TaxID=5763 RepID=A0A6A5BLP3_NAEFO|nr:uncharacterized protein FDP41_005099 [Naegleria fowleri]KAF0975772.1 hypothetical protein FDP41_005099 [Naegleria fowleri]